jgi:hypothetical protein
MKHFKLGQKVKINIDNENYDSFRDKVLIIADGSNEKNGYGYDSALFPEYLYSLKDEEGNDIPFSLYDYELVKA